MLKLQGYAPDIDQTEHPGVLGDCSAFIPSTKGMKAAPSESSVGLAALAATCQGAAVLVNLDETARLLAGTSSNVYDAGTSTWTSRSSGHSLAATDRWRFAIQGNLEFAVSKTVKLIGSVSGAMSTITKGGTDAPKAAVVATVNEYVFLGNYDDGTDTPDGVFWSAKDDYTDWTPAIATQCGNKRLYDTPGKVTGLLQFGNGVAVYKKRAVYIGRDNGAPFLWGFELTPGDSGALCQEVIVATGTPDDPRHYFMSHNDFWVFDGVKSSRIGTPVRDTVFDEINRDKEELSIGLHDRANSLIYWYYPTTSNNRPDKCVVYNYRTGQWGRDDRIIHGAINYIAAGDSYSDAGTNYSTYADLPNLSYGSAFPGGNAVLPAVFDSTDVVQSLTGVPGNSSITLSDLGDDEVFTDLQRAKPRYLVAPTTAEMVNSYKANIGDSYTQDKTTGEYESRFDVFRESRWHKLAFNFSGDVEISGIKVDLVPTSHE